MSLLSNLRKITRQRLSNHGGKSNLRLLNPLPLPNTAHLQNKEEIYKWIKYGIGAFREWYQPVDFGNGVIAHRTFPPDWQPQPDLLYANDAGMAKWNYIIKRHLPQIQGKRVLDLGSSSGIFSIELARMGAKEVIGIDRNPGISHRSTATPPAQDVVAQANFVKKSFELLEEVRYPVTFIAQDIAKLEELKLGRFDLILALNVIYHELDNMPKLIRQLVGMTDYLILQACEGHVGELKKWANKLCHAELLLEAGFSNVEIDAPDGYLMPVVIGRKGKNINGG